MLKTVFVVALFAADLTFAGAARQVDWDGVSQFTGKTIRLIGLDAVAVTGTLEAVQTEALVLVVRKSTSELKYPKGRKLTVARPDVHTFEVLGNSKRWRVAGAAVGFFIGMTVAAAIELAGGLFTPRSPGRDVVALSAWGGCTIGGFFLGRSADRRSYIVTVHPGD